MRKIIFCLTLLLLFVPLVTSITLEECLELEGVPQEEGCLINQTTVLMEEANVNKIDLFGNKVQDPGMIVSKKDPDVGIIIAFVIAIIIFIYLMKKREGDIDSDIRRIIMRKRK